MNGLELLATLVGKCFSRMQHMRILFPSIRPYEKPQKLFDYVALRQEAIEIFCELPVTHVTHS